MAEQLPLTTPPKSRALSLWVILVGLLVLAVLSIAALGAFLYLSQNKNARQERALFELSSQQNQARIAAEKAAAETRLALARNRQEEVLAQARQATNVLERLLQGINQVTAEATALKTSDPGRRVALHADLLAQARHLFDTDLPALAPLSDITTKLENARRVEQTIVANLGKAYEPEAGLSGTAQNAALWAEQEQRKVAQAQSVVASLVRESAIKVTPTPLTADSPTLEAGLRRLAEAEAAERQRLLVAQTIPATSNAMVIQAQAEVQRILEAARAQSNDMFRALQAQEQERLRQEELRRATNQIGQAQKDAAIQAANEEAKRILQDALAQSNRLYQAMQEKAEAQQREQDLREASNKVVLAKVAVQVKTQEEEARNVELRKKASDPKVRSQLAPFITPGYWQVDGRNSYERFPLSYTQLRNAGALDPSRAGIKKLGDIGSTTANRERSRWVLLSNWMNHSDTFEKVKDAQQLLLELGPVLVELKLLQP